MTYLSLEWLAWVAGVTVAFWTVPARLRGATLVGATSLFLLLQAPASFAVLVAFTFSTHYLTRASPCSGSQAVFAVVPIATLFIGFKVWSAGVGDDLLTETVIPLGLSYYALRCVHYILERYKGTVEAAPLRDLVPYLFFLPTIYVGPIHRFAPFARDLRRHRWDGALFSEGLERILYGYVKIVVLGNFLVSRIFADWAATSTTPDSASGIYLQMVEIGFNLYFQFAGYSDVAIGFSRLLGFRVMENFRWPFLQKNISAFWRSWHISLTSWCREYVYTSVFAQTRSPALGAMATLVVIALWHEVSFRYLLWGCYHGLGIVVWQTWQRRAGGRSPRWKQPLRPLFAGLSVLLTVHFVWLGFLLVRQPDMAATVRVLRILFTGWL